MTAPEQLRITLLDSAKHDRAAFTCGAEALDRYLKTQAGQDMRKRAAAAYVLTPDDRIIYGFYTLSQYRVDVSQLADADVHTLKLPKYPELPATLLGRLAVSTAVRGKGFGELLLFDALKRSLELSVSIASTAVVVDAKDQAAIAFYLRYGFVQFCSRQNRLFLPMKTIAQLFK